MSKVPKYIALTLVFLSNCKEAKYHAPDNLEISIKKFVSEKAERTKVLSKSFYEHYDITKVPVDTTLFTHDIYRARYLLAAPTLDFYVAYSRADNKIIDLGELDKEKATGFSQLLNYDRIEDEFDLKVVITTYLETILDVKLVNKITDIPGAVMDSVRIIVIHPMEISKEDNTWLVELFTWSERSGKVLKHMIEIDSLQGFRDNINIVAENVGSWKAPM